MIERRIFRVAHIAKETSDVMTFHLVPKDGKPFKFKAGQFVNLYLDNVFRPYSISSSPKNKKFIELTIKLIKGKLTSKLAGLEVGHEVEIAGPFGEFSFDSSDIVMIACGIGITPIMSHLREVADKKLKKKITLFYSARTKKDMIFRDELEKIQRDCPSIHVVKIITREKVEGCENKRIDFEMISRYISDPKKKHYLVCGPKELSDNVQKIFNAIKVPLENVKIECWG